MGLDIITFVHKMAFFILLKLYTVYRIHNYNPKQCSVSYERRLYISYSLQKVQACNYFENSFASILKRITVCGLQCGGHGVKET